MSLRLCLRSSLKNDGIEDLHDGFGFKLLYEKSKLSYPDFAYVTISNHHVKDPATLFVFIESLDDKIFFNTNPSRKIYIPMSSSTAMQLRTVDKIMSDTLVDNFCISEEALGTCSSPSTISNIIVPTHKPSEFTSQINELLMEDVPPLYEIEINSTHPSSAQPKLEQIPNCVICCN